MGLERRVRVVLESEPPFVSPIPPPKTRFGGGVKFNQPSPRALKNGSKNEFFSRPSSESILAPNFVYFEAQNELQMHSECTSMSSLDSLSIFASKTKGRRIFKKTTTFQNSRTIVQKSTWHITKLAVESHLSSVWIWYQNRSCFYQISTPKVDRKQTSSCDAVLASKVFQNALSELARTTLGPLWPHQARFVVSKTPSQSPHLDAN